MYFRSLKKFLEVFGKSRKGKRVYSTMGRIWPIGLDTVDARPAQLGQGPPSGRIAHASGGRRVRALGAVTVPLAGTVARRVMTPRRLTRDEVVSSRRRGTRGAHQETREAVALTVAPRHRVRRRRALGRWHSLVKTGLRRAVVGPGGP
jgi:hypothetical protein